MAFFCPGSGAKIKKEFDNHNKRHHDYQGMHSPSQPPRHQTGYQSPQVTNRHQNTLERVHDSGVHIPVSTKFFQKMIVLHDHYPTREMELAVRKGEKVEVVKKEPEWLFVRNERGKEGYVPARNCFAPVSCTRRPRSGSRSSSSIRPVMSGEVMEHNNGVRPSRGGVPMYSSSSAGKVRRYESPMLYNDNEHDNIFQRINSPSSAILSPYDNPLDTKGSLSSSSGVSLMDTNSPALTRAFSQDEFKPYNEEDSMISLSQSAIDPNMTTGDKTLIEISKGVHHKHSSSDDSGTVDSTHLRDLDYASTIRNGETSSEECLRIERVSSGGVTPSIRDRPLPSPPKSDGNKGETPPPVPPRNASLETSRQRGGTIPTLITTADDLNPYAQPVDVIDKQYNNRVNTILQQQQQQQQQQYGGGSRADINDRNSGVESPYSEVYRPQQHRRPINVQHDSRDSPLISRKNGKNHRNICPIVRRTSPLVNGSDHTHHEFEKQAKGIMKFRKYLWGVFICMKDFEGMDENEVSVAAGEQVMVFNQDDQFWYWIVKHKTDQSEGFVPASILREVDDSKTTIIGEHRQKNPLRPTSSPPTVVSTRPRGQTTPLPHPPSSGSSHRTRVKSVSSMLSSQLMANSIEKIPFDIDATPKTTPKTILAPSSPPPPYAEQDPIVFSQPTSHDNHMTSNHSIPRTGSHHIVRTRPPTYPRTRSSTSQMYHTSPLTPMYQGHISQSATRLNHAHQNNFPSPTVTTTGGTLV